MTHHVSSIHSTFALKILSKLVVNIPGNQGFKPHLQIIFPSDSLDTGLPTICPLQAITIPGRVNDGQPQLDPRLLDVQRCLLNLRRFNQPLLRSQYYLFQ